MTTLTIQEINPEKIDHRGNPYKIELHPIEIAAFDYCVKHGIDRKGWKELVSLIKRGHKMHLDWADLKIKQGRVTDVVSYRLVNALNEPE